MTTLITIGFGMVMFALGATTMLTAGHIVKVKRRRTRNTRLEAAQVALIKETLHELDKRYPRKNTEGLVPEAEEILKVRIPPPKHPGSN